VLGWGQGRVEPLVGERRRRGEREREHPGPDGQLVVGLVVLGRAAAHLGRHLGQRHRQDRGGGRLLEVCAADGGGAPRHDMLDEGSQGRVLLGRVVDRPGAAEDHHRAVVQRVMEGRAGQHQPVQQGDGDADLHAGAQAEPAAGRAVQVEVLADACVPGRDHVRLLVHHEADMAEEALVQDGVDGRAVVGCPFGQPPDPGPGRRPVGHQPQGWNVTVHNCYRSITIPGTWVGRQRERGRGLFHRCRTLNLTSSVPDLLESPAGLPSERAAP
jgi:hypothetical protein